jgi:hypothetical protein
MINPLNIPLTENSVSHLARQHTWAATGVSDYPPRDPLVGQSRFFMRYQTFIHTVDQEDDHFAHVFAVEGEWGRGKSRLGHELIAQINDCSRGWFVRGADGTLENKHLFDQSGQDKYLALYIRYSQVASEYQNSDNWFGFGLYKALLPLATQQFDGSIQSKIAEQALRRIIPLGFEPAELVERLQLLAKHSDEILYDDPVLVVGLVKSAYAYLQQFGIEYVLVVLDELETVAEAATFGLEQDDTKRLDGQAIRLIGKAIKEEDPRSKLPWLRYVALCSPLLGQQLREIQSVARRFELVELEHNAFADVSDYVVQLKSERKLGFDYPIGLVEAAYAMSGANFGWFNVIMANVDAVLAQFQQAGKPMPTIGNLFETVVESSGRVAKHVLDKHAIEGIKTNDHDLLATARALLYGQLPLALKQCPPRTTELLTLQNEDGEPVASLYRKIPFDALQCRQALEEAKFQRDLDAWFYPAVEQALSLTTLLQNLRTFAINEAESEILLLPLAHGEFKHLLSLLYDHPAVEFAADALWQKLIGNERQLPAEEATHIGPSVAMLLRLDLRYRSQQHNSMIFRDPTCADAHELAMKQFLQDTAHNTALRFQVRLTGLFRLLDKNWAYAQAPYANKEDLSIQLAPKGQGQGQRGGLLCCDALKLHPDSQAWFAWANHREDLDRLHKLVCLRRRDDGRMPVMVFTASAHLMEQYNRGDVSETLRDDMLLYYLNPSEVDQIERIGLLPEYCKGFELREEVLTSKFKNKLNTLRDFAYQAMQQWRKRLNERGLIAWPLRPSAKLNPVDRDLLFKAWKLFKIDEPNLRSLNDLEAKHGLDAEEISALLQRLTVGSRTLAQGYSANEHAGLFTDLANPQQSTACLPLFLASIANPAKNQEWTLEKAKRDWYWGYLWQGSGLTAKGVFDDWMWWCGELHLLELEKTSSTQAKWISYPRSAFDNAITEARNWFDGNSADGYQATVKKLERVFGYDRIPGLFASLKKSPTGTETVEANDQLLAARTRFDRLKLEEEALVGEDVLAIIVEKLPGLLQGRSEILKRVGYVKPIMLPAVNLGNINALVLDDKRHSLYQRIEQARLFAEYVDKATHQIKQRSDTLIAEMDTECAGLKYFPKSLFTLSLQTVPNILDGALQQHNDSGTSIVEGTASSDTLMHYLRSLQLDKAAERLRLLANETGINIDSGAQQSFAETSGHILSAYRDCKAKYQKIDDYLLQLNARCTESLRLLDPLPSDYIEINNPQLLADIQQKLILIGDAFEDLADNAKNEREKFREQARKGLFEKIREVPDRLLTPIQSQLNAVGGDILTIENSIVGYREAKLSSWNAKLPQTLAPLFAACKALAPTLILLESIKDLSLHDLQMHLDSQTQLWEQRADVLLESTGLNVSGWTVIATAISNGSNPAIDPLVQQRLVDKGILKVQLAFGGLA